MFINLFIGKWNSKKHLVCKSYTIIFKAVSVLWKIKNSNEFSSFFLEDNYMACMTYSS